MQLEGKTVMVTGSGKGIGKTIATRLADEGANVIATGHKLKNAESTCEEIVRSGGNALAYEMDVTEYAQIQDVVDDVTEKVGEIDALINNAGVSNMTPFLEIPEEEWDHNFDVNAKGVFLVSQVVAQHMVDTAADIQNGTNGKIINIASVAGRTGAPLLAHYVASKWAVLGLTRSMALELADHNINVNAVCPGYVKTGMQERELEWEGELTGQTPEEVKQSYIDETPLGRLQEPDDVADLVQFLASDLSNFITGQTINTCGGVRMD